MFTYTTKVRIIPEVIKNELVLLRDAYLKVDPNQLRDTHQARSAFSRWNNLNHFYLRLTHQEQPYIPVVASDENSVVIEVVARAQGNSARIYFKPSVTSLTKEIRKAIVPLDSNNVFITTDLKAAEFALRAVQAQDAEALRVYQTGDDIYMHFANLFPEGTSREIIKTTLIANCYGTTPYRVGQQLGISDTVAERILQSVENQMPKFSILKKKICALDLRLGGYYSPKGFDQSNLVRVADIKGEFNPNMAWSAYTQSALGFIMQDFTTKLLKHQKNTEGTILSVFDSVIVEINPSSQERFETFFRINWAPLLPDGFKTGSTMYEAMYN